MVCTVLKWCARCQIHLARSLTGDKMDEAVINQVTQDQLFNWLATANASVCLDT